MAHAPDIELDSQEGLLGCALLGAAQEIRDHGIVPEHFLDPSCKLAWEAILTLLDGNHEVHEAAVFQECKALKPLWISQLANKGPVKTNWHYHAPKVIDVATRHRVWGLCNSVAEQALVSAPSQELIAQLEAGLLKAGSASSDVTDNAKEGWREVCDLLATAGDKSIRGLMTGISGVDKIYRGLKKGSMNTLAARPGQGKSAFAANLALKTAKEGGHVLVFSAEMPAREYELRLVAIESGSDVQGYLENAWTEEAKAIAAALSRCHTLPISIVDDPAINANQMKAYARKVARNGLSLVIVDYLQLYRSGRKTHARQEEVSEVSKAMKQMAMECDVPVLVLAQMNRGIESREGKPRLSDLRESGSIEQDSDTVAFIHTREGEDPEYIVAKHRAGATGEATVNFTKFNQRFSGVEPNLGV